MRYFDDFEVGEEWPIDAAYEMTEEEIVAFAAKWDPQPFHINKEAAGQSVYGTLTACGTHIQAVVLWLASRLPHETAVCIEKRPSGSKPDRGIVKNRHILANQDGETVFTQTTTLLIKRKV